ncbi:MAG: hypothetical protein ACHQ15_03080 [Candidatus Limnocylindrales bacterium]
MRATRRSAVLEAVALLAVLVPALVAACARLTPPPSPDSAATPSPAASPTASSGPTLAPSPSASASAPRYPVLLIRADEADGLRWFATDPGDPTRRHPLAVPAGVTDLGPAAADGSVALTSPSLLVIAVLRGGALVATRTVDLGRLGLGPASPACRGPEGSVTIADEATLALTVIPAAGSAIAIDVPDALGECAWLPDGRLLAVREDDRLVVADPRTGRARAVGGGSGRHPTTGGGLLALVDRSGPTRVVLRAAGLGGPSGITLGPADFVIDPGPDELITRAELTPDGTWLAVDVTLDPEGSAARRLRLYRLGAGGAILATEVPLGSGEQVIVMPAS